MAAELKSLINDNTKIDGVIGLASIQDRMAASILDIVLLIPLVQLIQAPVKKSLLESLLFFHGEAAPFYRILNFLILVLLFIVYDSLFTYFKGQTIGKKFFKIKVISYQGHLDYLSCLLRSFSIFVEMICLFLPLISMGSHPLRRPIHDRVADTLVISLRSPVGFPSKKERIQSKILFGSLCLFLITSLFVYGLMENEESDQDKQANYSCPTVKAQGRKKMTTYIELFLLHKASPECLFKQARKVIWSGENKGLGQFAMALSLNEDLERSDQYLKTVCKENPETQLCGFSHWILENAWSQAPDLNRLDQVLSEVGVEDYQLIISAGFYNSQKQYSKLLGLVERVEDKETLAPFMASMAFIGLMAQLRWDEALWVYKTHKHFDETHVLNFLRRGGSDGLLSNREQIDLLELFYPQLTMQEEGRGLASSSVSEVFDFYQRLKEGL